VYSLVTCTGFLYFLYGEIKIYDYRDCRTFVGLALSYADPVKDCRRRNRSAIPSTGYGPASAQIQVYLDRMTRLTRFSHTGYLPGIAAPAIYRKTLVQSGTDLTVYIRPISRRVDLMCILYIFLYIFMICTRIGLTFCQDYTPDRCGSVIPPNIGIYIYIYIYIYKAFFVVRLLPRSSVSRRIRTTMPCEKRSC